MPNGVTWSILNLVKEVRQRKTNTVCFYLYMIYKNKANRGTNRTKTESQEQGTNGRLPDICPLKVILFEITKGLQFRISNHEEPHASPHWTRKGKAFIGKTWKLGG